MAAAFPYAHYACPCSDLKSTAPPKAGEKIAPRAAATYEDESTFNPHNPRANYSLYPLDHLLYCDECDAIRCPRCWIEEVISWYCPTCLFEVPSSTVTSDGNRCARNCYDCPTCFSPLTVTAIARPSQADDLLKPSDAAGQNETYILQCHYCAWSSLDAGIHLSRPTKVTEQLLKLRKSRGTGRRDRSPTGDEAAPTQDVLNHDDAFANLASFYKDQLAESSDTQTPYANSTYNSPAHLARIMTLYGGLSYSALKKTRERPQPMREANDLAEGHSAYSPDDVNSDDAIIQKLADLGWDATTTAEQKLFAPVNNHTRFVEELWPVATALRTRRGKRCKTCRQFLTRPEPKNNTMRYKIRLLAMNHIPRLLIRPFSSTMPPAQSAFRLKIEETPEPLLQPHLPLQYILTVRNPIFETIKVTLATLEITPGKVASRVTILCPSFTVGPAGDIWDEALGTPTNGANDGGRKAAMASLTGSADADRQPEAGKIWQKSRNSTSVVLEIVPGSLERLVHIPGALEVTPDTATTVAREGVDEQLQEDDDVLEIPIYIRVEWDAHVDESEQGYAKKDGERKAPTTGDATVSKELAYWCVLGVGRLAGES